MRGYDNIEGFEYWNTGAWKEFIKENVAPLNQATTKLLSVRGRITEVLSSKGDKTLSEVKEKSEDVLVFLLGGIAENGEYKENSLAKLTRMLFGFYVNPSEWVTIEREEGINASDYVTVKAEDMPFTKFLKKVNESTESILKSAEVQSMRADESEKVIQDPQEILNVIRNICAICLNISANHSYYTFFIESTKFLPWRFVREAYPKLRENFEPIMAFLGMERLYEPKVNEKDKREDYTMWGHSEGGLAARLSDLNQAIWECFADEKAKVVLDYVLPTAMNLKQEFTEKSQQELTKMGWNFPDYIHASNKSFYTGNRKGVRRDEYVISGLALVKERSLVYSWREHPYSDEKECSISLFKLLDDLSPALFLGTPSFELKISGDVLEIIR